jgi:hypothetical protein
MRAVLILIVAALLSAPAAAEGPDFLRPEPTIHVTPNQPCDMTFPSAVPVRCWKGQQFVVLPIDPELRSYGYQMFLKGGSQLEAASYVELAGKVVTVTDVSWKSDAVNPDMSTWAIAFRADDTGETFTTRATILPNKSPDDAIVDHLASMRDLLAARSVFSGKTFWMKAGELPQTGENGQMASRGIVHFRKFVPISVEAVVASYDHAQPARIVLKNGAGSEGYFYLAMSGTNGGVVADPESVLATTDPKVGHNWSPKVWAAIEDGDVFVGMTSEQAMLSCGKPRDVNNTIVRRTAEQQWVYGAHNYLYIEDGRVSAIQN